MSSTWTPVKYPFTVRGLLNSGGFDLSTGLPSTPDYRLTFLRGPRMGDAGPLLARLDYVPRYREDGSGQLLSGRPYAKSRYYGGPQSAHLLDWDTGCYEIYRHRDYGEDIAPELRHEDFLRGDAANGTPVLEPASVHGGRNAYFYSQVYLPAGWTWIEDGLIDFGDNDTGNRVECPSPRDVPSGGAQAWAVYQAQGNGFIQLSSPLPGVHTEIYTTLGLTSSVERPSLTALDLIADDSSPFVEVHENSLYYVRITADAAPTAPVTLTYTDPHSPPYPAPPATLPLNLEWSAPTHTGGMPLTGYAVRYRNASGASTTKRLTPEQTSVQIQAKPGTLAWVHAQTEAGDSAPARVQRAV